MKKLLIYVAGCGFSLAVLSCNSGEKDSVEIADSTNRANLDSPRLGHSVETDAYSADFIVEAADGGMAEVHLGALANQKGSDPAVKEFGSMMIHDHSAAGDQITLLAGKKSVTLPSTVSDKQQKKIDDLTRRSGADFDRAYINAMIEDHEADIKAFEKAAGQVTDAEVKSFINTTLPTLRMHLDSAKAIKKRLK